MPISPEDDELERGFWAQFVDVFIFTDLQDSARKAGANFLVALGGMCYVDFFGKLMSGKQGSPKNFKDFVRTYMPQYAAIVDDLYREVRCGLVHSYFPENVEVVGQSRRVPGPAIWRTNNRWSIAVVDFIQELKVATEALKADVLAGKYINEFEKVVLKDPGLSRIHHSATFNPNNLTVPP